MLIKLRKDIIVIQSLVLSDIPREHPTERGGAERSQSSDFLCS